MTKTQYHKVINRKFYRYLKKKFPQYTLDFGEVGGIVVLFGPAGKHDVITYHQREHWVMTYNYALDFVKDYCAEMEKKIKHSIIPEAELLYNYINNKNLN